MKILHIGHSAKWRGGENQTRLLIERALEISPKHRHYLAYPKGAAIFDRLNGLSAGNVSLYSKKPFDPRSIFALITFCKTEQIDVLHAHSATAHTLALLVKKVLNGVKLIVHRRVDNPIKKRRFTRAKYLSSKVDKFISVSKAIGDILDDYGVPSEKVELVYDSIDTEQYGQLDKNVCKNDVVNRFGWSNDVPLIGFISAIDSQKNPVLFVEIIKNLMDLNIPINAIMAGDGKLMDDIRNKVADYGLAENLKLLGFVKGVEPLFSALDIFVLPSRNEGLGTVMLEAIAANTVVVASNVGGIGEVIIDQQTGRLVGAAQADDYVDVIVELINSDERRMILSANAEKHVANSFSFDNMVKNTLRVYDSLFA